jgi:thiol-disulfide isomerase/thioredoxin
MTIRDFQPGLVRPHEILGELWINSEPISILTRRGYVILVDFWDYTCSGSLRILPYLKDWFTKYSSDGLIIVGVHTPRFGFGRKTESLARAVQRLGIRYPVVTDNEGAIWSRYGNRQWPAQYLIDRDGFIRFSNIGEGGYGATEHVIQTLMLDAGLLPVLPDLTQPFRDADRPGVVCFRATPELYAGYVGGSMGNVEGVFPESEMHYSDPGIYVEGRFYVEGDWSNDREDLKLVGENKGQILLRYSAQDVTAVFSAEGDRPVEVEVRQNGEFLTQENRGSDVKMLRGGRSVVSVDEPRAYQLVRNREHGEHLLKMTAHRGGISLYCISFTPGAIPELIPG